MISEEQYSLLQKQRRRGDSIVIASAKAGMNEKTGRKYMALGKSPETVKQEKAPRRYRTRKDPFAEEDEIIKEFAEVNGRIQATRLLNYLNSKREAAGKAPYGQGRLRTLQRKLKQYRALYGSDREVFFDQEYQPGELGAADFTDMKHLRITIAGKPFVHKLFHFVLPYSHWETVDICFSESYDLN